MSDQMLGATISMASAHRIWSAHREIEVGQKLLHYITEALSRGEDATPLDPFGRRKPFTLGVPMGDSGHRMLDVSPILARYVIEAHIAAKRKELAEASIVARMELEGAGT